MSDATGPEDEALQEALDIYVDIYGELSTLAWIEAERDEFGATFLARRGDTWMEAPVFADIDGWVPGTIDYCTPRPFTSADSGDANWWPDPAYPAPGSADTEIHVLVMEIGVCQRSVPGGKHHAANCQLRTRPGASLRSESDRLPEAQRAPATPRFR